MREIEDYRDRGMKKWAGFYLSEHTERREHQLQQEAKQNTQKRAMDREEIQKIIQEAIVHSQHVAIQLEAVDIEGNYYDDISGKIVGGDELGLFIEQQKVDFDEIRHIQIISYKKWSEIAEEDY